MKWLSVKECYYFKVNEVKGSSAETVVIMPIFSPLPDKLARTLHAAQIVNIIPISVLSLI
jgi:hypothetical protein